MQCSVCSSRAVVESETGSKVPYARFDKASNKRYTNAKGVIKPIHSFYFLSLDPTIKHTTVLHMLGSWAQQICNWGQF